MDGIDSSSSQPGHLIVYYKAVTRGRLTEGDKDRQTDKI